MADRTRVKTQGRDWDELAQFNPEWAVLTEPDSRAEGWDAEAFFASGQAVIEQVFDHAESLGLPAGGKKVLDFGCGVGRVAPALGRRSTGCACVAVSTGSSEEWALASSEPTAGDCTRCS